MNRKKFLLSAGAVAGYFAINPIASNAVIDNCQFYEEYLNDIEMNRINRNHKEGKIPMIAVNGTAYECGLQLGEIWRDIIRTRVVISSKTQKGRPWWSGEKGIITQLLDKYAPHLPDIMRGMQTGAGLGNKSPLIWDWPSGAGNFVGKDECTAFAVKPEASLDGIPLSGQTKDTENDRLDKYQILKLEPKGFPSFLTLTYPGELFGHGFATTGVSLFRNALNFSDNISGIPFHVWGLIALCSNIDIALDCAFRYGVKHVGNALISDSKGRSVSVENIHGEIGVVETDSVVHVHTNHLLNPKLQPREDKNAISLKNSEMRYERLKKLLEKELKEVGKISSSRCLQLLGDHENFPSSICRHSDRDIETTAAVVVEPTIGRLHIVKGYPCMNWPVTYSI